MHPDGLVNKPQAGVRRGLFSAGGVIIGAGLVLAATFAVLGVLLDTVVVRSLLIPALLWGEVRG